MPQSLVVECSHPMLSSKEKLHSLLNLVSPLSPKSRFAPKKTYISHYSRTLKIPPFFLKDFEDSSLLKDCVWLLIVWKSPDRSSWIRDDDFYAFCWWTQVWLGKETGFFFKILLLSLFQYLDWLYVSSSDKWFCFAELLQIFALSATEVGSLISMGSNDSSEFFHDPSMKSRFVCFFNTWFLLADLEQFDLLTYICVWVFSNAGQVRKSLSIMPHADGSGYFFSLSKAFYIYITSGWSVWILLKSLVVGEFCWVLVLLLRRWTVFALE